MIENDTVYYVRTDQIGRPMFATDDTGKKVWEASYLPFGGVQTTTGTPINLRFPGQWFQSESGLHQNWMRDYDPATGRYLQADPLGLVDGASIYGYALQNPGRYSDPRGEAVGAVCAIPGFCPAVAQMCIEGIVIIGALVFSTSEPCDDCQALPDCDAQWDDARTMCIDLLSGPNPPKGLTGGYTTLGECMRGFVSEECGGNKVEY